MTQINPAFSRNIGWLTPEEQESLSHKRVAIAGMGGVGGNHLLTLTRLGVGLFNIADFDTFDIVNFNRQVGATISNLDRSKDFVMMEMAKDINPDLNVLRFEDGVNEFNVDKFLKNVDVYIDGLDFFAFKARAMVFKACAEKGIPAITAAPLGMGASVMTFMPGGMTFEEYFRWGDLPDQEKAMRFLKGMAPSGLQSIYLTDPSTISFEEKYGPSTFIGCQLAAALASTEALKILLGRGKIDAAPKVKHFDAYLSVLSIS
jgi:molybdopterin/thiamine biosynthesis adenylyltransferase